MHSLTMSSSLKEVGHNGVQSPQVAIITQIWFATSVLSPRDGYISIEVVAMDPVDILVGKDHMGQIMQNGDRA